MANVTVFCASSRDAGAPYFDAAAALGRGLAQRDITLVFGGSFIGPMGAMAEAALAYGGRVVGVMPRAYKEAWAGAGGCEWRLVDNLAQRKELLVAEADAIVALPGGTGTLEELMEALSRARLGLYGGPVVIVNLDGFFDGLLAQLRLSVQRRFLDARHLDCLRIVSSVAEALAYVEAALPRPGAGARPEKRRSESDN
jgi:uncharacterized protein (TIGR00730 family)